MTEDGRPETGDINGYWMLIDINIQLKYGLRPKYGGNIIEIWPKDNNGSNQSGLET